MITTNISQKTSTLNWKSPWVIIFIFSILGLLAILNHSMWRDELNPWLIVRDSKSFTDLINNINYEGHPVLWYFSLAFLRKITDNPIIMQLFHLGLAISSVILLWLYSPFSYRQKLLFTFGYLPFYEFLLISRNYAYGMLLVFAICVCFPTRKKSYIILSLLLGLLANTNAYALFISFALLLTLLVELCFDVEHRNKYFQEAQKYDIIISIIIITVTYLLAIYIIIPPSDSYLHGGLNDGWSTTLDVKQIFRTLGRFFGGYYLIIPTSKRWLDLIVCGVIALFTMFVTFVKLSKKPIPWFFYLVVNLEIITFAYFRFVGSGPRHFGHFYIAFIAALWIESYYPDSNTITKIFNLNKNTFKFALKWQHIILMISLYMQFFGGIYGFTRDLIIPFSASRATVEYIRDQNLENEFIVASRDANMAAISGYLNRQLYYPELQTMGSFTIFNQNRKEVEQPEIFRQIYSLINEKQQTQKVLLILHKELQWQPETLKVIPIKKFEKAWVDTERYYLYWVQVLPES
ncbi:MAG: hypothetical protein EAZ87_12605 [Nostocales cyanobacterium]|nr:MAG: hypothetical protein EAZ87_12605 [Nostocales cyanobacterium]